MHSSIIGVMLEKSLLCSAAALLVWSSALPQHRDSSAAGADRKAIIARAQVWRATDIPRMDLKAGPDGGIEPDASITCDYVHKKLGGATPKFACRLQDGSQVKIKYGPDNGEVYAAVAATRLLWALGFGADAIYPVRVTCRGCPDELDGLKRDGAVWFGRAVLERTMAGRELSHQWHWVELDEVDEAAGGAPRAHRDALKLLAVLLQHADSKPVQQRIVCVEEGPDGCAVPMMMIHDLGMTFGAANTFNAASKGSVNLAEWEKRPVWKHATGCVGNLSGSVTGTLEYPAISEAGRQFLAGLLIQLSDRQITDMFDVAHFDLRGLAPSHGQPGVASIDQWVSAFETKRAEIVDRRCPS